MGHSTGEMAAAYAAGHVSLRQVILLMALRCVLDSAGAASVIHSNHSIAVPEIAGNVTKARCLKVQWLR